jgi:hypothetical protein
LEIRGVGADADRLVMLAAELLDGFAVAVGDLAFAGDAELPAADVGAGGQQHAVMPRTVPRTGTDTTRISIWRDCDDISPAPHITCATCDVGCAMWDVRAAASHTRHVNDAHARAHGHSKKVLVRGALTILIFYSGVYFLLRQSANSLGARTHWNKG